MDEFGWLGQGKMTELRKEREAAEVAAYNCISERFGLTLSAQEAGALVAAKNESLKKHRRVEFGRGILEKLIFTFCDSQYISQDDYAETLMRLADIFYDFKNESQDKLTDEELLNFMKEQFETICEGDTDYLASTCLANFVSAVRMGYRGYQKSQGKGEYGQFDEVKRWDPELYMAALRDICWK